MQLPSQIGIPYLSYLTHSLSVICCGGVYICQEKRGYSLILKKGMTAMTGMTSSMPKGGSFARLLVFRWGCPQVLTLILSFFAAVTDL